MTEQEMHAIVEKMSAHLPDHMDPEDLIAIVSGIAYRFLPSPSAAIYFTAQCTRLLLCQRYPETEKSAPDVYN